MLVLAILNVAFVIIGVSVVIGVIGSVGVGTLGTLATVILVVPRGHTLIFLLNYIVS